MHTTNLHHGSELKPHVHVPPGHRMHLPGAAHYLPAPQTIPGRSSSGTGNIFHGSAATLSIASAWQAGGNNARVVALVQSALPAAALFRAPRRRAAIQNDLAALRVLDRRLNGFDLRLKGLLLTSNQTDVIPTRR